MKIAFVVDRFPALSETFVLSQITGLIDRGHDVDVLARAARDEVVHPDVRHYRLVDRTQYWPALPAQKLLRWLKGVGLLAREAAARPRAAAGAANVAAYGHQSASMNLAYAAWPILGGRRYDVIHCHFGENGVLGMALRDMGVLEGRLITSFYGYDLSSYLRRAGERVYARLLSHGDLFLPVSEVFRQRLIELGCDPAKVSVHRMGIDCRRFGFRARSPADDGVTRLISVSRLVEKKGIEYAIRAVAQLTRTGRRVVYTVIGEGPLGQHLAGVAASLGASDSVRLVGKKPQPDVIAELDSAHVVVAPSVVAADGDVEGTPAVLMEAMAMGLPAIATRHSGIPEVVEDGVSGVLVPERDVGALAGAIAEMADHPERWPAFGRAGRDRIQKQHDIETLNDSLVASYQRIVSQSPRSE
jgi:colanic acid/amylovoran biosynthesis glycosyltransferase